MQPALFLSLLDFSKHQTKVEMVETQDAHEAIQEYPCEWWRLSKEFLNMTDRRTSRQSWDRVTSWAPVGAKMNSYQSGFWETKSSLSRCSRMWHWPPTSNPAFHRSKPESAWCWTSNSWLWTSWSQRSGFWIRRHKPLWSGTLANVLHPMLHICLCSWMNKRKGHPFKKVFVWCTTFTWYWSWWRQNSGSSRQLRHFSN